MRARGYCVCFTISDFGGNDNDNEQSVISQTLNAATKQDCFLQGKIQTRKVKAKSRRRVTVVSYLVSSLFKTKSLGEVVCKYLAENFRDLQKS